MTNFLTQETPGKVIALLGSALFSLAFLFAVTSTNASWDGVQRGTNVAAFDIFSSENVVALLDTTANSYNQFLAVNLFEPAQESYNLAADNIAFVFSGAADEIAMTTGFGQSASGPAVAGASVTALRNAP